MSHYSFFGTVRVAVGWIAGAMPERVVKVLMHEAPSPGRRRCGHAG